MYEEYIKQTETFRLSVSLSSNQEIITFHLDDYANAAIYQKSYNEDNIGKEIHKKLDLHDLLHVFSPELTTSDSDTHSYLPY